MGTQQIPDSQVEDSSFEEIPRVGPWMWLMLAAFLLPPAAVTLVGNMTGALPHQTLWVILLGAPVFLIFITLPRRYELGPEELCIRGLFYARHLPLTQIQATRRMPTARAILHPGSMYCSDPSRALLIERKGKRNLLISPRDPADFAARLERLLNRDPKPGDS